MTSPNNRRPLALQLLRASAKGHLHDVMDLLHRGATLAVNKHGRTALHISSHRGYLDIVRTLLGAGCNPDIQDDNGDTALHRAVSTGNIHVVQCLLNEMCSVDRQNQLGDTALHEASRKGSYQIVQALVKSNANHQLKNKNEDMPLHMASAHGRASTVQFLLSLYQTDSFANAQLDTPLHLAVRFGHKSCVKLLLSGSKCDKDAQNEFGNTALHLASLTQNTKITRVLLNSKVDCNICNKDGKTAVQIARDLENGELVIMLMSGPRPETKRRGRKIKKDKFTKTRSHSVPPKEQRASRDKTQETITAHPSTRSITGTPTRQRRTKQKEITVDQHYKQLNFNPYVVPQLYSLYRNSNGEIEQRPVIESLPNPTPEIVNELHKAINETKEKLSSSINQKNSLLIKRIQDLEAQLEYQFNSIDKLNKERINAERTSCLHRINQRAVEERHSSEQYVNRQLSGWVETRLRKTSAATPPGSDTSSKHLPLYMPSTVAQDSISPSSALVQKPEIFSHPVHVFNPALSQTADSENRSLDSGVGGSNWHHIDAPSHFQHVNPETMGQPSFNENILPPINSCNDMHGKRASPVAVAHHENCYNPALFYQQSKQTYQNSCKYGPNRPSTSKLSYPTAEEELLVKYLEDEMACHDYEGSPLDIALIDGLREVTLAQTHAV